MFIDEILEDCLIEKGMELEDAFAAVCEEKLSNVEERTFTTVRRLENGYQCFRRRHKEFPVTAFRIYVALRSPELAKCLGWLEKDFVG